MDFPTTSPTTSPESAAGAVVDHCEPFANQKQDRNREHRSCRRSVRAVRARGPPDPRPDVICDRASVQYALHRGSIQISTAFTHPVETAGVARCRSPSAPTPRSVQPPPAANRFTPRTIPIVNQLAELSPGDRMPGGRERRHTGRDGAAAPGPTAGAPSPHSPDQWSAG